MWKRPHSYGQKPGSTENSQRKGRVAASAIAASLLGIGLATPAMAEPVDETRIQVDDVSLAWEVNPETSGGAYFGVCNFLSAGRAGDTGRARVWAAADGFLKAEDGNVKVQKPDANGELTGITWDNKCRNRYGTSVAARTSGLEMPVAGGEPAVQPTYTEAQVEFSAGEGWVDPESDSAYIEWEGSFTIAYYGGMTYWSVTDPALLVENGVGTLTGTASGYGTDMDDMEIWTALDPQEIHLADLQGIQVTETGIQATPAFLGVSIPAEIDGRNPQADRTEENESWWGSFPASWLVFNTLTGQDSYWYTTAGGSATIQPRKVPSPIEISYEVETPNAVPAAPAAPAISVISRSAVEVSWTAPESDGGGEITSYTVTLVPSTGDPLVKSDVEPAAFTTTFDGLLPGISYLATVQAVNEVGASPVSAASSSVTPNANPAASLGFTVSPDSDIDPTVENVLTVEGQGYTGGAAAFGLYVVVAETGTWAPGQVPNSREFPVAVWLRAEELNDGAFSRQVTIPADKLSADKSYFVGTFAANQLSMIDRRLDAARPISLTVPDVEPALPEAPSAPAANADGDTVVVTWEAPADNGVEITGFEVTLSPVLTRTAEDAAPLTTTVGPDATTATFTGVPTGSYVASVATLGGSGSSAPVSTGPVEVAAAATTPAAVSGVAVVPGAVEELTVSWTPTEDDGGSPVIGHRVTLKTTGGVSHVQDLPANATSAVFSGLDSKLSYRAAVVVYNQLGDSEEAQSAVEVTPKAKETQTPDPDDSNGGEGNNGGTQPGAGGGQQNTGTPTTPVPVAKDQAKAGTQGDKALAATGGTAAWFAAGGALLLVVGGFLAAASRRTVTK